MPLNYHTFLHHTPIYGILTQIFLKVSVLLFLSSPLDPGRTIPHPKSSILVSMENAYTTYY